MVARAGDRDGERTYVLTNAHVVEPGAAWKEPVELRVLVSGKKGPFPGRVVARGHVPEADIAQPFNPAPPQAPD